MLKRRSEGQELGELVSTARNTQVTAGSFAQFAFHQSDMSKVSFPLPSFLTTSTSSAQEIVFSKFDILSLRCPSEIHRRSAPLGTGLNSNTFLFLLRFCPFVFNARSTLQRASISCLATDACPFWAAMKSGVVPSVVLARLTLE
jgi:hypothetical protein